jgi:hypothetical protein
MSIAACDRNPTSSSRKAVAHQEPLIQDLKRLDAGVRITAANKRIDELERKVGELEHTPEKLDLDLLTSRVTALEVKANGAILVPEVLVPKENLSLLKPTGILPQPSKNRQQTAKRASTLNLPDLEKRSRLATPTEAKAFSTGK